MSGFSDSRLIKNLTHNLGDQIVAALKDPAVVEIMLNADGRLWVERFGDGLVPMGAMKPEQGELIISLVASSLNSTVTVERPIVEGELPLDGSRFEGLMPPIVAAPSFTIRKKASRVFTLDDYVASEILPLECREIIEEAILERRNILVAGGTGTGKTTLVNAVIDGMARLCADHRLVIIEDTAELQSTSENVLIMRTSGSVDMRRLVMASMRLRPDRILVGEVRDGAALDLIKAWGTGHPGGVSTVHATSAAGALRRLERLVAEATEAPMKELIAESIDLIIFLARTPGGRKVMEVAEVVGLDPVTNQYQLAFWLYEPSAFNARVKKREPLFVKAA